MKWGHIIVYVCLFFSCFEAKSSERIKITADDNTNFQIGAGIYDITGPAGGVGMMGYAQSVRTFYSFI